MRNFGKLDLPDFAFWVGIVEAIGDVERAGRVKVRIFGYHTADKSALPTSELPYAVPINPVTSAGVNGIMESPNFVQGSTVVGAFMDGDEGQVPVIFGTIAGVPAERDFKDGQGFSDPDQQFPREGSGTAAKSSSEEGIIAGAVGAITDTVTDAVTGAISSLTGGLGDGKDANDADVGTGYAGVGEPDISRLARGEAGETHYSLVNRRAKIAAINAEGVATAKAPFTKESAKAFFVLACHRRQMGIQILYLGRCQMQEVKNKTKQNLHKHITILNQEQHLQVRKHLCILLIRLQKHLQA